MILSRTGDPDRNNGEHQEGNTKEADFQQMRRVVQEESTLSQQEQPGQRSGEHTSREVWSRDAGTGICEGRAPRSGEGGWGGR